MAGFLRRYTFDPGLPEITSIEGVITLDRQPPPIVTGVGTGTVLVVGEFENGPFETPTEVFSGQDVVQQFGDFGYTYNGIVANNPCARSRKADGALLPEYWNGNGQIALNRKAFSRLVLCRVDTSVGSISFNRLAALVGAPGFTYDLEPGQTLVFDIGAGNVTATFNAAVATTVSAAGVYPSTFAGGESITLGVDGVEYTVTFLAADQTHAQVVARVNQTLGYAAWSISAPNITTFVGRQRGTGGSVQIVAVSGAIVTTATGFTPAAAVAGTGDVANIDAVTVTEVDAVVNAASPTTNVDRTASGAIRIYTTADTIEVDASTTATAFGFATGILVDKDEGEAGVIPAGTRVQTTGGAIIFVTMQDLAVTADSAGPYSVKVRHALDDGTGLGTGVSTVIELTAPIALGAFAVTNDLAITAALGESAIDAKYVAALGKTKNVRNVSKEVNLSVSARQSNIIRTELRQNALDASANGCFGRLALINPPLNTTRADARSDVAQPGVGAYRSDRIAYGFPGARTNVASIALRGTDGGAGFTADGNLDVHVDAFYAALLSQLPPEENPAQQTSFLGGILDLEAGNADVQDMSIGDYKAFRAAGIAALHIDGGNAFIQSGVVAVDPSLYANIRNISRRRMADFIQDSLALVCLPFVKKLATKENRGLLVSVIRSFLKDLLSEDKPENQRIAAFTVDGISGNTPTSIAAGVYRITVEVKLLGSLDFIVLNTTIGESVEIEEAA